MNVLWLAKAFAQDPSLKGELKAYIYISYTHTYMILIQVIMQLSKRVGV